ncbi:MAG TPA: TIGR04282 family arsenosugar biosynthesis glycosyltransferase [Candidatus Dormibacteraeota bacterium]|nr:TIGR04282 family arsenosugar biosynthesis glycosyltransferase [Candidatus Dormibacteraeota bacterium]
MSAAIAIFAKAPIPGRVKTRLVPPLSREEAAAVARACLETTLRRFAPLLEAPIALFLDGEADGTLRALAGSLGVGIVPQVGADLGARLEGAFRSLREGGATKTVALGSDSPTVNPAWIAHAIASLDTHDAVIGPTEDGGYYLIGLRAPAPELFRDIPWSTDRVARATLARASALGLAVDLLPAWYDVDDIPTLRRALADGAEYFPDSIHRLVDARSSAVTASNPSSPSRAR